MRFPNIKNAFGGQEPQSAAQQRPAKGDLTRQKVSRLSAITAVACAVAVVSAGYAGVATSSLQQELDDATAGQTLALVSASKIPAGSVITEDMLTTVSVPASYLSQGAIVDAADAIGCTSLVTIEANSQISAGLLSGKRNGSSLAGSLESGQKAVSITVTAETDFACSLLHQGDLVSLYYWSGEGSQKQKHRIARDVEVVALDGYVSYADLSADGVTASYSTVTVAVKDKLAQEIRELQDNDVTIWMVLTAAVDASPSKKK